MGCDIHAYIDYDEFLDRDGKWYVSSFANDIDIGHNYQLFDLMAGVRHDERRMDGKGVLVAPRGIPERVSSAIRRVYTLRVVETASERGWDATCTREEAQKWIEHGQSQWYGDKDHISHPDWHTASWLTAAELEQVQAAYSEIKTVARSWYQFKPPEQQPVPEGARVTQVGSEWYVEIGEIETNGKYIPLEAVIAAMKVLDGDTPGRARLVFWFDN